MNVLLTGGLGMIGSALLRSWPEASFTVLDSCLTERRCSLFNLPRPVSFLEQDVREADLAALVAGQDVVVHLAALTDGAASGRRKGEHDLDYLRRVAEYYDVNVRGTQLVADACLTAGVPLIFPSTTSVYGPQAAPVDEGLAQMHYNPQSPYAETKAAAEAVLNGLMRELGLRYTILRFGTVYGPSIGTRFVTAIPRFCWQAATGQPLTVWREALHSERAYCAIDDAVAAIKQAASVGDLAGDTINVVTGNHTVAEVVDVIRGLLPDVAVQLTDSPLLNQHSYKVLSRTGRYPAADASERLRRGISDTLALLCPQLQAGGAPVAADAERLLVTV